MPGLENLICSGLVINFNRRGITSIFDAFDTENIWYKTIEEILAEDRLTLRVSTTVCMNDNDNFFEKGQNLALKYGERDSKLYFWGFKLLTDGVGAIRTAWLTDAYVDDPPNKGYPLMDPVKMREGILRAEKSQYGVHVHACGTRAVEFALDTFAEAVNLGLVKGQRNSITHCDSINDKDFSRFGELGIIAALQPDMLTAYSKLGR